MRTATTAIIEWLGIAAISIACLGGFAYLAAILSYLLP